MPGIAFQQTGGAAVLLHREHAGQKRPDDAAHAMHAEGVERIVIAERVLETGGTKVAPDAAGDADHHGPDGPDEAGSRGDRDETGDGA